MLGEERLRLPISLNSGQVISAAQADRYWRSAPTTSQTLRPPMPVVIQPSGTEWCWAVVVTSTHNFLDQDGLSPCTLVDRVRPGNDCCHNATSYVCAAPDEVGRHLDALGNARGSAGGSLTFVAVQTEIAANNPVCAIVSYPGGAHAVVICGWVLTSGRTYLIIMDPQAGAQGVEFDTFTAGYPAGGHWAESQLTKRTRR